MITLRNGGAELCLLPETGGAVTRFAVDGSDVLRPAPPTTADVLQTACFPLVPFANRIANGRFTFAGDTVQLPRNFGDHPHALHGDGWQNPWRIEAQSDTAATLVFDHAAGAWPWDYTARHTFSLAPRALTIELEVANRSARTMPVSLGLHPYFERTPRTRLTARVAGVWLSDASCIPTERAGPSHFLDLANGAALAGAPFVDHCHDGWDGAAVIAQPEYGRTIQIAASSNLSFLHCYVPQGAGFFCAEPVSAMPDAINRSPVFSGLRVLGARESLAVSMTLACARTIGSVANSTP